MNKVFVTGDKHRNFDEVEDFCQRMRMTPNDIVIILGDTALNWFGDESDEQVKRWLNQMNTTFLIVRGNHDMRPEDAKKPDGTPQYTRIGFCDANISGSFLFQMEHPNLLFAIDGESYLFRGGISMFVIGGAYSIDKPYRVANGYNWFPNEQLSRGEKIQIGREFRRWLNVDFHRHIVLSHTCPYRFIPHECKLSGIPRDQEDLSTERWMDGLYKSSLQVNADLEWYCGHWHTDKEDGPMHFMYHGFKRLL